MAPQHEDEGDGEEEPDLQQGNEDAVGEPQNVNEDRQSNVKISETTDQKSETESDKDEKDDALGSEEESGEESDTDSDSEYSSAETSEDGHTDHGSSDKEVLD